MPATSSLHLHHPGNSSLCPLCGGHAIRIKTDVEVAYDIVFEANAKDFRVIDEVLGDAMWDAHTPADCPRCHWHGTVGELRASPEPRDASSAS